MKNLLNNLDKFIIDIVDRYNNEVSPPYNTDLKLELFNALTGMYGGGLVVDNLLECIFTLVTNDLDVGDAYYTKTDGEPTLKKFMVNEARLRQANESRGRMKNEIDKLLLDLVGPAEDEKKANIRVTNIDSLSAYVDRLATERIKEYNFKHKQNKILEADHQHKVVQVILTKIGDLINEINIQKGYAFIGEKRTFDEKKLIEDVTKVLKNVKND